MKTPIDWPPRNFVAVHVASVHDELDRNSTNTDSKGEKIHFVGVFAVVAVVPKKKKKLNTNYQTYDNEWK